MKSDEEKIKHIEKLKGWMAIVAFLAFHSAAWFLGPFWFMLCLGVSAVILVAGLDAAANYTSFIGAHGAIQLSGYTSAGERIITACFQIFLIYHYGVLGAVAAVLLGSILFQYP